MADPDVAGLVHEQVLDGVPDGEGRDLAAERVEDLDLVRVLIPADAGCCDDEPAVGQAVQMRPAGPHGTQLGEFDVAARMDGDDQRVEGKGIAAGLRSTVGKQPVRGTEDIDGTGQDVAVVVRSGQVGVGNEGSLLHGQGSPERAVTAFGRCGERRPAVRERWRAKRGA
ncbi:hypothetical protein [Streptomyces sp. NPDC057838]|uniref:hypothetical protein n=1 Tax=unclassified Streptomyces TaxID=2593676 RepID=UPI00368BDC4F